MSFLIFKITQTGATPRHLLKEWRAISKKAWFQTGRFWHQTMRPKHFTKAGALEYGYIKRKGEGAARGSGRFRRSYTGKKLKRFGHDLPLVYTGISRLATSARDIRASSRGVRIVMKAPNLTKRHPKSQIDMRKEMTTISTKEGKQLARFHGRQLDRGFKRITRTSTTRI